jgi:hypothetical protein
MKTVKEVLESVISEKNYILIGLQNSRDLLKEFYQSDVDAIRKNNRNIRLVKKQIQVLKKHIESL